jgi:teichuronic acid biosynthesis glycosyltransferase TuaC
VGKNERIGLEFTNLVIDLHRNSSFMKVLVIACEWPTPQIPHEGVYIYRQVESLRQAGIEVDVFAFQGQKKLVRYISAWKRLRKEYRISNYDLVHAHYGQSAVLALPKQKPLVITFHGSDLLGIKDARGRLTLQGRVLQGISQMMASVSNQNIVVGKEMIRNLGQRRAAVLPCGIDLNLFTPTSMETARKTLGLSTGHKLVFFAANPQFEVKRFHLAQAAVQMAQKSISGIELITANNIPHEMMPQYMNACNVLLLTSMHEGSPQVVKEAMACNLPVVSVAVGDVKDRIAGMEGCWVCEDDSPETISKYLVEVLRSNKRTDGRESILPMDEKIIVGKLIQIYQQVLSSTNS